MDILANAASDILWHDYSMARNDPPIASQIAEEFAARLTRLRVAREWSRKYVADQLRVSKDRYTKWEQGVNEPPLWILAALAELFSVSVTFLVTGNQDVTILPMRARR